MTEPDELYRSRKWKTVNRVALTVVGLYLATAGAIWWLLYESKLTGDAPLSTISSLFFTVVGALVILASAYGVVNVAQKGLGWWLGGDR